jgi:putative hydrolase of the HAD superfamily
MAYRAVIFDLFGTLIRNFSRREYRAVLDRMAALLGAPADEFARAWFDTFPERNLGLATTAEGDIRRVCRRLNVFPSAAHLAAAARLRIDLTRRYLVPREGALEVLGALRARGLRLGLITDCTAEAPLLWPKSPLAPLFDAAVFSCIEHVKKPDPAIYRIACERLGVTPRECLYVGDGSSRELTGARQAGMRPIHLRPPGEDAEDVHRVDVDTWSGEAVRALTEVLALVQ